jgi:hypothetical protein
VSPLILLTVALTALLSAAVWALYTAFIVKLINDDSYLKFGDLIFKSTDVDLAYEGLYLLVCVAALVPAVMLVFREHSLVSCPGIS